MPAPVPVSGRHDCAVQPRESTQQVRASSDASEPVTLPCAACRCRAPRNDHKQRRACVPYGYGKGVCPAVGLVETCTLIAVN